jgi:hypothetical protein
MIRSLLLPFHSISLTEKIVETCILDIANTNKLAVFLHCRYEARPLVFLARCSKKRNYHSAITTEDTFFLKSSVGSGSESGSFRMFLGLPNPDPLKRGTDPALDPVPDPDPSIVKQK